MSEDLVPVNITCVQELPEVIFHITAYNSQVEKILDVRLLQPGKGCLFLISLYLKNICFIYIYRYYFNASNLQVPKSVKPLSVSYIGETLLKTTHGV